MSEAIDHVNASTWSTVTTSSVPVLVDFWAEWCGPCRAIAPVLEDLAKEYSGKLKIVKVNVDEAPDVAQQFSIRSIPTLLIFKGGAVADQSVGALSKAALKARIDNILG